MDRYRLSNYNHFLKKKDRIVGVNLHKLILFSLDKENFNLLTSHSSILNTLEEKYPVLFSTMLKLGVIEETSIDVSSIILMKNRQIIFSNSSYHLFINPTLNCNFSCWYCYETHCKLKMDENMINSVMKFIKNLIVFNKISFLHIDWFGGEPLLCYESVIKPICIEVKSLCSLYNVKYIMSMTTNGYLLKTDMLQFFVEHNFVNFQITLDCCQQIHDSIRFYGKQKRKTFYTIVNNIIILAQLHSIYITLRVNYTKETILSSLDLVNIFPENLRKKIKFMMSQIWQDKTSSNDIDKNYLLDKEFEIMNIFEGAGFKVFRIANEVYKYHKCYADLKNQAVINYNGKIYKCTALDFETTKEDGILSENGEIIWNENVIAKRFKSTFDNSYCLKCNFLPICSGRCSFHPHVINKEKGKCDYIKRNRKYISEKMNKFYYLNYKICHLNQV